MHNCKESRVINCQLSIINYQLSIINSLTSNHFSLLTQLSRVELKGSYRYARS